MIYDKLLNIEKYFGIHKNLDTAIQYIKTHDLSALPLGKTELTGSDVYCNVMMAAAQSEDEKEYEIHKKHMDIQIDLQGMEAIRIGTDSAVKLISYDSETDFGVVHCCSFVSCTMGPGRFLVCRENEPHMPGLIVRDSNTLKKCVFKIPI